jgi:hypothetical protein
VNVLDLAASVTHVTAETRAARSADRGHAFGRVQVGLYFY